MRTIHAVVLSGMAVVFSALPAVSVAQTVVYLPPSRAETVASAEIRAEAAYRISQGYYLQSAAIARKINAEAAAIEIENSVKQVEAYWKRKTIWEEEWHKRHPSLMERQRALDKAWDEIITKPGWAGKVGPGVTDNLNELFARLTGPKFTVQYSGSDDVELKLPLTARDQEQIWLNDSGRGARMIFCLAHPQPMATQWPFCLTAPEFDPERKRFEQAREAALDELRSTKQLSFPKGTEMMQAVNALIEAVDREYPPERRKEFQASSEAYQAKQYLTTLFQQVVRTVKTTDRSLFDGQLGLQGNTLGDLLRYMFNNGLRFEKPQPGGEGVYNKLFASMRNLYVMRKEQQESDNPAH